MPGSVRRARRRCRQMANALVGIYSSASFRMHGYTSMDFFVRSASAAICSIVQRKPFADSARVDALLGLDANDRNVDRIDQARNVVCIDAHDGQAAADAGIY